MYKKYYCIRLDNDKYEEETETKKSVPLASENSFQLMYNESSFELMCVWSPDDNIWVVLFAWSK